MLVVRADLGIGIHAPYDMGRSGYYNMQSFGKSLAFHKHRAVQRAHKREAILHVGFQFEGAGPVKVVFRLSRRRLIPPRYRVSFLTEVM